MGKELKYDKDDPVEKLAKELFYSRNSSRIWDDSTYPTRRRYRRLAWRLKNGKESS